MSANLADWIKERRRLLGFTQAQIAMKLGIHQAQVSALESGKFQPDKQTMSKINDIFGEYRGDYVPAISVSVGDKKGMSDKTKEALRAYRETKENGFYLKISDDIYITADRNQYILHQGTNLTYFTEIKFLIKHLVSSQVRQSAVSSVEEILNKMNELYKNIELKFDGYDPADVSSSRDYDNMESENDE